MDAWPDWKANISSAVDWYGSHTMVIWVLPPTSANVVVEKVFKGQAADMGWRVRPPWASEKLMIMDNVVGATMSTNTHLPHISNPVGVRRQ